MYGEWWAKLKARRSCSHSWVIATKYQVIDFGGGGDTTGGVGRRRVIYAYRCELCGKKRRETEYEG